MPLLTLAVTGSPAVAGTVAAAQALGGVIGFLPGGVLADRYRGAVNPVAAPVAGGLSAR